MMAIRFSLMLFNSKMSERHKAHELTCLEKEYKRIDNAFWSQFNEKASGIPGCPGEPTCLPGRRPAASCQVAAVVLGGHDGRLQILIPDARRPVPNGQEVLGIEGIPYQAIHWAMVPCHPTLILHILQSLHLRCCKGSALCSIFIGGWFYMFCKLCNFLYCDGAALCSMLTGSCSSHAVPGSCCIVVVSSALAL